MKFKKWLAWFCLASLLITGMACAPFPQSNEENFISVENGKISDSIINGTSVSNNNPIARSVVAIYNDLAKTICTGSLLANNLVLTAAHCTTTDPRFLYVIFETDFSSSDSAQVRQYKMRQVTVAMASPVWKRQEHLIKNQGDIGLLKFNGPVPAGYIPVSLLTDFTVLKKGVPVVIAGYGVNNATTKQGHRILRQTSVLLDNPQFSDLEMSVDQSKGRGACLGDSGGPAYVYISGKYYLWGVINRGYSIGAEDHCDKQGIYSRVDIFASWIRTQNKTLALVR